MLMALPPLGHKIFGSSSTLGECQWSKPTLLQSVKVYPKLGFPTSKAVGLLVNVSSNEKSQQGNSSYLLIPKSIFLRQIHSQWDFW